MKAVVKIGEFEGINCMDIDTPILDDNKVLIKVKAAAICGTDMDYYEWGEIAKSFTSKKEIEFPFVLGHECCGEIVEIGKGVKTRSIGDRVSVEPHIPCQECYMCKHGNKHNCLNMQIFGIDVNGGFAEYVAVDEEATYIIPNDMSWTQGALLEPAGVAMNSIDQANVQSSDIVLVYGCGPIGLFLILLLREKGIKNIIAIDRNDYKLAKAAELGAVALDCNNDDIYAIVKRISAEHGGVDVVFEATGSTKAYPYVFDVVRKEGKLITIGHPRENIEVNIMNHINLKGLSIKGIFGRIIWETWDHLIHLIKEKKINLEDIISGKYTLEECDKAFRAAKTHYGKTVFVIGEDNG